MISETEKYHGFVFSRIIRKTNKVTISRFTSNSNSSFVIEGTGIFIKYSTKRMSPWNFTFLKEHQEEIKEMHDSLGHVVVALVCGDDGIASLSYTEIKQVLDDEVLPVERIGIRRSPRGKYKIGGSDGKLNYSIGDNEFPDKLFNS